MTFASPLFLWALTAIPVLLAIYFFIDRAKTRIVSAIFLYDLQKQTPASGRRFNRFQHPLSLFLEMLIIVLFILAASQPLMMTKNTRIPLVLVLDNSFSMTAGDPSPREKAEAVLKETMGDRLYSPIHVIIAGSSPRLLGNSSDLETVLGEWQCGDPSFDEASAMDEARRLSGGSGRILVITDSKGQSEGGIRRRSFGVNQPNLAITHAVRSHRGGVDRLLIEVTNFSDSPTDTVLKIAGEGVAERPELSLEARQTGRFTLDIPNPDTLIALSLGDDALLADNSAHLAPVRKPMVRIETRLADPALNLPVSRAFRATGKAVTVIESPDIFVTNRALPRDLSTGVWTITFHGGEANSLLGPFILNTNHPFTDGLGLGGVIWNAPAKSLPGSPVISAGDLPLVSEEVMPEGRRIHFNFDPNGSNLHRSPNWPILLENIIRARHRAMPGLVQRNLPAGSFAELLPPQRRLGASFTHSDGTVEEALNIGGRVRTRLDKSGVYSVTSGPLQQSLAVNAFSRSESDLSQAETGDWGEWPSTAVLTPQTIELAPWLILAALLVLIIHAWRLRARSADTLA